MLRQAMLQQEWSARRGEMMEIYTSETGHSYQHREEAIILEEMKMMTLWTSTDWEVVEGIEHRNMDIIMEDLGLTLVDSMEVDTEEAWLEIERMEILEPEEADAMDWYEVQANTRYVKLPGQSKSWMVWRDERVSDAKEYGIDVDLRGVILPDLIGKHEGTESQDNHNEKETDIVVADNWQVDVDEGAYKEGGTWFMDKWLPAKNINSNTKVIKQTQENDRISSDKLQMMNLITL